RTRAARPGRRARVRRPLRGGPRDPRDHDRAMSVTRPRATTAPPGIEEHPDTSDGALQALRGDFDYFQVAGSGPTFPVAQHADEFLAEVDAGLRDGARALLVSLVSCRSGDALPAAEACRRARAAGAIAIVDAAQALGQVPVDVRALDADAIVTLGHKWLHGPLATGAFWVRELERFDTTRLGWRSRLELPPGSTDVNPDATRFETGTVDAAAFVGLRQT